MYRLVIATLGGIGCASMAQAQARDEVAFVKALFARVQPLSIASDREYCGYIGLDDDGNLAASAPRKGRQDTCRPNDPDELSVVLASYHTHGAYSEEFYNEVPSGDDMEGDEAEGIDGWVATPGGRLWYIDSEDMVTSQICGLGCLPADPDFVAGDMGDIAPSYSYDDLVVLLEE